MPHPTDGLLAELLEGRARVAVVGLGYVGLPLAVCLARRFSVVGYDVNDSRIRSLKAGEDVTNEVPAEELRRASLVFSTSPDVLRTARFIIVTVPTPIDAVKRPDIRHLRSASADIGRNLEAGSVVVYESTVYPGCTRHDCIPIIERESGLQAGREFGFGYSPERINPADRTHTVDRIPKVVSGSDASTLETVAGVYGAAIQAEIHRASSIEVAEAAKVIENTQRDLNIALINELALIFNRLGIDTNEVLAAAGTKWNFLHFRPGLVGGHCIGVDPYYLTHKAEEVGYHPEVILAGRRINDGMGGFVARECVRLILRKGRPVKDQNVLVLGLTFKENCPDIRNTRVIDIVHELESFGARAVVVDPIASRDETAQEYGIELVRLDQVPPCQAIVAAVAHDEFRALEPGSLAAVTGPGAPFLDIKASFDREGLSRAGFDVWRL